MIKEVRNYFVRIICPVVKRLFKKKFCQIPNLLIFLNNFMLQVSSGIFKELFFFSFAFYLCNGRRQLILSQYKDRIFEF